MSDYHETARAIVAYIHERPDDEVTHVAAALTAAVDAAVDAERKRCVEILQLARCDEIDRDWRSIIYRIEAGDTVEDIKAEK